MTVLVIDRVIKDKEDTLKLQRDIDRFDLIPKDKALQKSALCGISVTLCKYKYP